MITEIFNGYFLSEEKISSNLKEGEVEPAIKGRKCYILKWGNEIIRVWWDKYPNLNNDIFPVIGAVC